MKKRLLILACIVSTAALAQDRNCYLNPVENVNTEKSEYNAVFNKDMTKMTYTEGIKYKHGDGKEYVMLAVKGENGWETRGKMIELGNKVSHIDVIAWPSDDTIYAYKGKNSGKIYIYTFNGKKWKKTDKFRVCKTRVKKCCFDSAYNTIYFSTKNKKTGVGGEDLYYCKKQADGKWGKPVNLGFEVNSNQNDIAPTLEGDSILYFASDREGGRGGYDIYVTVRDSGVWSKPVNLGSPLNSEFDDAFYTLTNNQRNVIISSNRAGVNNGLDLYVVTYILPKHLSDALPKNKSLITDHLLADMVLKNASHLDSTKITLLKGMIMGDDSVYLKAKVALSDNGLRQVIATQEAEDNGAYEVILPGGHNYGIAVSYPGYLFHSENFDLPEQNEYKEIKKDIVLKRIAIGKNVALRNLFFETNKSDLNDASITELANVIQLLNDNPTLHIEIEGHTDNVGSKAYNQTLSEARARSVVNYLVEHGIDAGRLTSKGYGLTKPVASNKTAEGRAENRRTELLVTQF